jgi:hypothetical protein
MLRELRGANEALWLVRASAWQPCPRPIRRIPQSASGRPLIGLGNTGKGACDSIYLEPEPAHALSTHLERGATVSIAIKKLAGARAFRCVPLHDIEVRSDSGLRAVQLVTTIQIGGAERVTLDLAEECNRMGVRTVVAALGEPTRRAYPKPHYFADLSDTPLNAESRAAAIERLCLEWGADVVHAHLIKASEAEAIRARGIPLAVTVHNMPASWPAGYLDAAKPIADLLIGCARAVSREVEIRMPNTTARTVWNGVDFRRTSARGRDSRIPAITANRSDGMRATSFSSRLPIRGAKSDWSACRKLLCVSRSDSGGGVCG